MNKKTLFSAVLFLPLMGACSATALTLTCGVDGDSSYVALEAPQILTQPTAKTLADLCSFNEEQQNATS